MDCDATTLPAPGRTRRVTVRRIVAGGLAAWLGFFLPRSAVAHNPPVHQDMTDLAYELMLAIASETSEGHFNHRPPTVPADQWNAFLRSIREAIPKLRRLPAGLPGPHKTACSDDVTTLSPNWADGKTLGELSLPVGVSYITGNDCGIRVPWTPGGLFDAFNTEQLVNGHRDHTGITLGFWANTIDDEYDDTHLWFRPTSAGGLGAVKKEIEDRVGSGLAVVLIPFVCAWDCLFGSCGSCVQHAKDLADSANPISSLEGLLPGIGDVHGSPYVGIWHFINMRPGAANSFDDRPGLLYEAAGPTGTPDAVELAIMAISDATGWSINYEESRGPHRYQIQGAQDGHPDTRIRNAGQWQFTTFGHTVFEPVDNLAFYGWKRFREDPTHNAHNLAWPLHALGDATVPMHVSGTSGWGHRPFEDAHEFRWSALRRLDDSTTAQLNQAQAILAKAFEWRRFILNWRSTHPGHAKDVPVRALVTALAQQAFDYARTRQQITGSWPYDSHASTAYLITPGAARDLYESASAIDQSRPLIENGIAAELAFLVSAAEVF